MLTIDHLLTDAANQHERIFFRPHLGNAGDALISEGFYEVARRNSIAFTEITGGRTSISEAGPKDLIIMGGGGSLASAWDFGAAQLMTLTSAPTPLMLLPQSLDGHEDALRTLRACDTLIVRDEYSLTFARGLNLACRLELDHDMALNIDPARVLTGLHLPPMGSRDDLRRAATIAHHRLEAARGKTLMAWRQDNEARHDTSHTLRRDDLSELVNYGTMDAASTRRSASLFLRVLSWYAAVETDRLHVGIGAALVGTPVRIHPNNYHKIRGVWEHSLAHDPRWADLITFVEHSEAAPSVSPEQPKGAAPRPHRARRASRLPSRQR